MNSKTLLNELLHLVIHSIAIIYLAIIWNDLPELVPTHFGIDGKPDDWTSPQGLLIIISLLSYVTYLLFLLIPKLAAKKFLQTNPKVWMRLRLILAFFLSGISVILVYMSVGDQLQGILYLGLLFSVFSIFLGNYLQIVKPNYLVGIRTPWTLESDNVWRKTHQVGGKVMFWSGLISIPIAFLIPMNLAPIPSVAALAGSAIFAMV